jgi:hypothetical protein
MKNNFAEEYAREQEIKNQYKLADSDNGRNAARATYEKFADEMKTKGEEYERIYGLYADAKDRGNDYIDFNECIWEKNVPTMIESLRALGIEKFTFSSTWSSSVEVAWLFTQNGCTLEGLVEINGKCKQTFSDDFEKAHGFLFSIH